MPWVPSHYPFSAIVGCDADDLDDLGLSLILSSVSPEIGGVLVRGEKGTAKSTAVRALASLLPPIDVYQGDRFSVDPADDGQRSPDGPFESGSVVESRPVRLVELPVGATEDRVLGSLHLEQALTHGQVSYEPGLLARSHRGLLYVDEVNLLHDHLVDLLLDAAATGRVTVERDGFSVEHAARFLLIGTMNPEEGELRPQLLDRFGLTVEIAAPREPAARAEVVRRRMAYDADPAAFSARFHETEKALAARIAEARELVARVRLSEAALLKIAEVCAAFGVDGLRADIVTARTAVAHAAWAGRTSVTLADIRRAALLALPHRRRRNPFDAPGLDEDLLDRVLGDEEPPPDPTDPPETDGPDGTDGPEETVETGAEDPPASDDPADAEGGSGPEARAEDSGDGSADGEDEGTADAPADDERAPEPGPSEQDGPASDGGASVMSRAAAPYRTRTLTVRGSGEGADGRRSRAIGTRGRRIGATPPGQGPGTSLHLVETVRAAASRPRNPDQGRAEGPTFDSNQMEARTRNARPDSTDVRALDAGRAHEAHQSQEGRTLSTNAAQAEGSTLDRVGRPAEAGTHGGGRLRIEPRDLRVAVREGQETNLILFCVDASGSMAARKRMTEVKTAVMSLLLDAYRRRDKVGLITFRGSTAELALPPTRSVDVAAARLDDLPAGGRTPIAEGLVEAARVLRRERLRDPKLRPLLVLVTDGRATGGRGAVARAMSAADHVAGLGVTTVVVDGESGPLRLGLAATLAARLGADHLPVSEVSADALGSAVRERAA
ncbi:magnesium chelatase subunit D [Nocardiopsis sp. Huas11]|uniref:VWA domain-containing protein n=1 Tax=Nocardiopsis sp. Huas11 TaxID=2183912 RepID=UPI000EB4DD04|nr:VWA domain-containing protein [Nocardiopsis sp. Huas11]RKS06777.1 magnesium chelatase subunit D [Nocardiopsis sp. Huas11]